MLQFGASLADDTNSVIYDHNMFMIQSCGLYYKHVTIVIYDCNDSVQYHKTTITIVIDDP
jgi:hypothetical protein